MAAHLKEKPKKQRKLLWIIVWLLSACVTVGALLVWDPMNWLHQSKVDKSGVNPDVPVPTVTEAPPTETDPPETEAPTEPTETDEPETESTEPLPDNRVDWGYYHSLNANLYAWIYIPGTGIDLPVMQAYGEMDDNFYLNHDMDNNYDRNGLPYTQKANAKDFSDPVTVIYGHNMLQDGVMFSNLLYYKDADFFAENEYIYIYQPFRVLTYRIVSAHVFDTRHILNSYDFTKESDLRDYLDYILAPHTMIANVREGVELTTEDHILTLSTCTTVNGQKVRYLVQGVLVDDQPTN